MSHFIGLEFNSIHLCLLGRFVYACICVSASVAISRRSPAKVAGPLILVISCPDRIAADTVFAPARGQRLCVCLRACVWCTSVFFFFSPSPPMCLRVLRCEANCEMIANAESGEREGEVGEGSAGGAGGMESMWGHFKKSSGGTDAHVNTNARARTHARTQRTAISSSLLCCWDAPDTYDNSVCVFAFACVLDEHRCPLANSPSLRWRFCTSGVGCQHRVKVLQTRAAKRKIKLL